MSFALLVMCVAGIAYGAASLVASLGTRAAWRFGRVRLSDDSDALLALRLLPALASAGFLAALVLPAFLLHEPADAHERPGLALLLGGLAGWSPLAAGIWRGFRAARASRAFLRKAVTAGDPVVIAGARAPARAVDDARIGIAVAGFFTPRLLVARVLLERLPSDELAAAVVHENEHVTRRDNLRRWLIRSAPDWLALCAAATEIESAFSEAAEVEADRAALRRGPRAASALASALVRVARMAPPHPAACASALHSGSGRALRRRVLTLTREGLASPPDTGRGARVCAPLVALTVAAACLAGALRPPVLAAVHRLIEAVVAAFA